MTAQVVPYIPESAPFSPEQREWLNGFLAGMFSTSQQVAAASLPAAGKKIAIYFASQSGTAERLAKKLAKEMKASGHTVEVCSLEKVDIAALAHKEHALFLASTYGEGDPPESARSFRDALFGGDAPGMSGLCYSVFCLGDKHYEHFCRFGIELDERLQALGAKRLVHRIESDVDVDQPFDRWSKDLSLVLRDDGSVGAASSKEVKVQPEAATNVHTRDNPCHALVSERRTLTGGGSSKQTVHISFATEDSGLRYEAGDACAVAAQNDPALISELLEMLPFSRDLRVDIAKVGSVSIEDALVRHLQVTRLSRKVVHSIAEKAQCPKLHELLAPSEAARLDEFMHGRGLIDVILEYPGAIATAEELVAMLPRLAPRLYSISSSPAAHKGEVHCTVGVVRYRTYGRERGGVASTMLADRIEAGSCLPIYIQPNKKFRLPVEGGTPMIMVGPGTGIAPFRSFLHERRALGHTGSNWLFFGERSSKTDFLYADELQRMRDDGHLTRLDTAFSRDQKEKIYVQDRMRENGAELWRWLNDGAQFYICGDASRMAKDVDAALHHIVERHGGMDSDGACEYVAQLHEDRRYHRDVY